MSNYYAGRVQAGRLEILEGPFGTHTAAVEYHAKWTVHGTTIGGGRPVVLLDTGSVNVIGEEAVRELLRHDPLLAAVFDIGRQAGRTEGDTE